MFKSNLGMIYTDIKDDLDKDRTVLFIGLPCQITGIKMFLKKEYEKLYTIDLILPWSGTARFFMGRVSKTQNGRNIFSGMNKDIIY